MMFLISVSRDAAAHDLDTWKPRPASPAKPVHRAAIHRAAR
jgi:hypothetical protein